MKYNSYLFVIIYCVITISISNAMETSLILNKHKRITDINVPLCAQYITHDTIAIVNKEKRSYTLNLKTKEEQTIIISDFYSDYKYAKIFSKKNKIITYNEGMLSIYDIKTKALKKTLEPNLRSFAWDSSKNTIFFCTLNDITQWNYNNDTYGPTNIFKDYILAIQPEQNIMCSTNGKKIFLHNLHNNTWSSFKKIPLNTQFQSLNFYQFSPNGSYFAIGNSKKIIIVDLESTTNKHRSLLPQINPEELFKKILFHPNYSILAVLYTYRTEDTPGKTLLDHFVRYYDIKTLMPIDETKQFQSHHSHDIGFSPDGCSIIITLENKCVELFVPFAIKEKCIHSLCTLNRFNNNNDQKLLPEINYYIIKLLLNNIISD